MTPSIKPNLGRTHLILVSFLHHQKHTARRVFALSPILKHLNTGTLAFAMFVALALLSSTHGKDPQTRESAPVKATKTEVVIDKHQDNTSHAVTEAARQKMFPPLIAWQFVGRIFNAFNGAFNDPSVIAYLKQQGTDLPDSPATSLPNTSGQPPAPSKSLPSQSSRSPSSY